MIYQVVDGQIVAFDTNFIEYLYAEYVPNNTLIVRSQGELGNLSIPDYINHVMIDVSNPVDIVTNITSNYNYFNHSEIKFFPFWAIWMSKPYGPLLDEFSNLPKRHAVSCLNGTQWAHRKLTYLELVKKPYFSKMIFSFVHRDQYKHQPYEVYLTSQEQQAFDQIPQLVEYLPNDKSIGIDLSINHPAYKESYINIVTETTVNEQTAMLSEKTFKPIIAGQLFVLIATTGAIDFLRKAGIDTFDDIIDHSYDTELDLRKRIQMVLAQVDRLVNLPLDALYARLKPRLKRNSEYFKSKEFRNQFLVNF